MTRLEVTPLAELRAEVFTCEAAGHGSPRTAGELDLVVSITIHHGHLAFVYTNLPSETTFE